MTLTLAIPARDDQANLARLLAEIARLDCADRVLVMDDASATPLIPEAVLPPAHLRRAPAAGEGWLRILRNPARRGPGQARNALIDEIETSHVLFFDSDDLPTRELAFLIRDLDGMKYDFCLFRHADSRVSTWGGWGQMPQDEALWQEAGIRAPRPTPVTPDQAAVLAETANYPWNKIYRTDFLKNHDVRCAETLVHEDVELHWASFIEARRILASSRLAARHFVARHGQRLTNLFGPERLEVFLPLSRIAGRVGHGGLALSFFRFAAGLLAWVRRNLAPEFHVEFVARCRDFLRDDLTDGTFAHIVRNDPLLARRLTLMMEGEVA